MSEDTTVTPAEARANAKAIREFWRTGQDSLNQLAKLKSKDVNAMRHGHRMDTAKAEADRLDTNVDQSAKVRRIAEEYTRVQIKALCKLVEECKSRFGPTHLMILLRLENRGQRDKLMRSAIRESWSSSRLERATQAKKGDRRAHVGRKPKIPGDPIERLMALDALAEKWCRWCKAAKTDLPKDVQGAVETATNAVRDAQTAVGTELERLGTGGK